jgi:hypothetical protein
MKNAQPRKQAEPSAPNKRNFNPKSTATEAQYERVLTMLRTGPRNTMEFRRAGVMAPAARIKELNDEYGYAIPTVDRVDLWDEWGFKHARIAVYSLHAEPEMEGPTC